jgi:hypothetical protein
MSSWNKLKSMFVVNDGSGGASSLSSGSGSVEDAVLKELEKYELPPGDVGTLPPATTPQALSGTIDFQALYDQAGIPNTDEVEALERFLAGLDSNIPDSSKLAAAKAFLGAIGKAPKDVITDAGRKIQVVRAVGDAKRTDTEKAAGEREAAIAELQRQIDEHRASMEGLQKDLEAVRGQCAVEESRLQGARVFFGHVGEVPPPGAAPEARRR